MSEIDVATKVRVILDTYGLLEVVPEEELQLFIDNYPHIRAGADSIWIPETLYEEPALFFNPELT